MPPRLFVAAIVVFWLSTSSWLFYREIWPRLQAGNPPAFTIDLTDEVGANTIEWRIYQKGDKEGADLSKVGSGLSWVRRLPDRTFELTSEFKLSMDLLFFRLQKISSSYRVNAEGQLLGLTGKVKFRHLSEKDKDPSVYPDMEVVVRAPVENGFLKPHVTFQMQGKQHTLLEGEPVPLSHKGSVLNPMHLVNKISGLKKGQSWRIPLLDPIPMSMPGLPAKEVIIDELHANVDEQVLIWHKEPVVCYRIDYNQPGQKVVASTWVRWRDGLVLQQYVNHQGIELTLVRENR
jgi:hypothetical protein